MNKFSNVSKHPVFLFVKPFLTIVLLLLGHYIIAAQTQIQTNDLLASASATTNATDQWKCLIGQKKRYYIDFEEVQGKLETIQLTNLNGTIVFKDQVSDLSSSTFYELNLKEMENGAYYLELHTTQKKWRKVLELK